MSFWKKLKDIFKPKKNPTKSLSSEPPSPETINKGSPLTPDWNFIAENIQLDPGCEKALDRICEKIEAAYERYLIPLEEATGVPKEWVGAGFFREASLNFAKGLHCGQPWSQKTTLVPKGRGPFKSWHEAAIDALLLKGWIYPGSDKWSFAECLERAEKFNGLGYRKHGEYSSYVCGWTNFSDETGRYVADHKFDPNSAEKRPGVAAIMLRLKQREAARATNVGTSKSPWMDIIFKDIRDKVAEIPGSANHPRIVAAHKAAGLKESMRNDKTSWCCSYAKLVLLDAGVNPERLKWLKAWARDFLKFGQKLSEPRYGCFVVLERNEPGGDSHITTFVCFSQDRKQILCAGGNQSNKVCEAWYQVKDVLGYRWPDDDMLRDMKVL